MPAPLHKNIVEAVYRRYGAQVERRCRRLLTDPDEAADAVQEVFVQLFTKGGGFRAESDWKTWLYRVATNICLNRMRNTVHRRGLLERHGHAVQPSAHADPALLDDREALRAVLRKLPIKTQRIAIYHYVLDMSQQEIAKLMGTSRQTVSKHLRRFETQARNYLRR